MSEPYEPTVFLRHNRQLRALLLESQVWFSAQDLSKLDPDQRRTLLLSSHGVVREELMLSESGLYAMLVHHFHQENRSLRRWITNEVVTVLRDAQLPLTDHSPNLSMLQWPGLSLSMLHWQCEPWIRLRDVPMVSPHPQFQAGARVSRSRGAGWRALCRLVWPIAF